MQTQEALNDRLMEADFDQFETLAVLCEAAAIDGFIAWKLDHWLDSSILTKEKPEALQATSSENQSAGRPAAIISADT